MHQPLVSVLMTAYNREKYIAEAIESVLNSTYRNLELIIVDDGSKDSTVDIAKSYAKQDDRIFIYINEKNLGDYPNRNKAASFARGKYLKYVDSDDMLYPLGLEMLVSMMEGFPDAGWGISGLASDKNRMFPFQLSPEEAYRYHYTVGGLFHKGPLSSLIKREVFEMIGGFSGKQYLGDFEFWHLLALRFPVVAMQQGCVWYREHDNQQMTDIRANVKVQMRYDIAALHFFQDNNEIPLSKKEKGRIVKKYRHSIYRTVARTLCKGYMTTAVKLLAMTHEQVFDFKQLC
jgi:glycosyltransferase involved in cell wall biosynthesis